MEKLGLSKELIFFGILWMAILILLIFAFIFVGVAAFGAAGVFGIF
jgi:hypothetical protein